MFRVWLHEWSAFICLRYNPCLVVSDSSLGKEMFVLFLSRVVGLRKPYIGTNNVLKRTVYKSIRGRPVDTRGEAGGKAPLSNFRKFFFEIL